MVSGSQITDLYAWAEFLSRAKLDAALLEDARRIVRATVGPTNECASNGVVPTVHPPV
ncbi:MAG: hypothetical protein JO069_20585 [Verrucomicrobia bacterium]|nr:hypothetical protein [Verrucomicrobiota bacterium]